MDKSLRTLAFLGCFPIHTCPIPPLTPQTTLDACIQKLFRVFFLLAPEWEWVKRVLSVLSVKHKALPYIWQKGVSLLASEWELGKGILSVRSVIRKTLPCARQNGRTHFAPYFFKLWFNFILGIHFFLYFILDIIHYYTPKNKPRIKLNYNIHVYQKNKP